MAKFSREHAEHMAALLRIARGEMDVRRSHCQSVHARSARLWEWTRQIRAEAMVIREHVKGARQRRVGGASSRGDSGLFRKASSPDEAAP